MSSNPKIYLRGVEALQILTELVGENITEHIHLVLAQLSKGMNNKKFKDKIYEVLRVLEEQGGPDMIKQIKCKIPTYAPSIAAQ